MKKRKKIQKIYVFKINAGTTLLCGPPEIWEMEAVLDVVFEDGTKEKQYISRIDLDEDYWQVTSKSLSELGDDEEITPYLIASWEEKSQALDSPYSKVIRDLDPIFEKIAVL